MEKFVQQYLSTYYYVKTSEIGNDGIYYVNDDRRIPTPHNGGKLLTEIVTVFGLEDVDGNIKIIINDWAATIKPDVDLEFYWKTMEDLFGFPIAQRIAAQTMGMDLVAVMPLSAPRVELMYMDFQYDNNEPIAVVSGHTGRSGPKNNRIYGEETFRQNVMQLHENQQNHIFGELDHPTPEIDITINDRDDSIVHKVFNKWGAIIENSKIKFG